MTLLSLLDAELSYGDLPLLEGTAFSMDAGERIGLIGRNGTGKSSLLGVIAGSLALDDGELKKNERLRIAHVPQEPELGDASAVPKHRLEEFLHRFKLSAQLAPEAMSGGERKREAIAHRKFDRFWAEEEAWIRKGIEARRTRNEGRVKRLEKLREERSARRARLGQVKLSIGAGQRSGKLVSELTNVSKAFAEKDSLIKNLDLIVSP